VRISGDPMHEFSFRASPGSLGDGSPLVRSRGEALVGGLGNPLQTEAVCRHYLQILTAETIKT